MKNVAPRRQHCAIYTRKSTEHNLDLAFNSLDAQREACEAYIKSQAHEGWLLVRDRFDDGGLSGASLDRPALQDLLNKVRAGQLDIVVVYKVDRLTRSFADFAKLVEIFDEHDVSFVSVTQSFNTTSSMGRLTLNVLLSFAQFEREVIGERVRDKIAASKRKGIWMGGPVPLAIAAATRSSRSCRRRRTWSARSLRATCVWARLAHWLRRSMGRASNQNRGDWRVGGQSPPPAIVLVRSRISLRTGSTLARSRIAARSIAARA